MKGKVKAIPEGFHTLTASLVVSDAAEAIKYITKRHLVQRFAVSFTAPVVKLLRMLKLRSEIRY
ncbi:Uncharacterised protein [uncultured archaeon]|nr:Uncharacterised protein [uncultured archaeon]